MKTSELIKQLQNIVAEQGDIPVQYYEPAVGGTFAMVADPALCLTVVIRGSDQERVLSIRRLVK